jgi:hypothetical protein
MDGGRRRGIAPIPADLVNYLNPAQMSALDKVRGFGWAIKFIRKAEVVLVYRDGATLGLLDHDGRLNHRDAIRVRSTRPDAPQNFDRRPNRFIV